MLLQREHLRTHTAVYEGEGLTWLAVEWTGLDRDLAEAMSKLVAGGWGAARKKLWGETLHPTPSTLNPQPSTLNPVLSTLDPQPLTLNPQPSTLIPQP